MKQSGTTLIELMITLSIAVILLAVAVPGFQQMLTSNRLTGVTNDYLVALNYARSEAVKRQTTVTLCPSSNGTSCTGTWSQGWLIFADSVTNNGAVDVGETLLRTHPALAGGYTLASTLVDGNGNAVGYVTYARNGTANNTGTVAICHGSTNGAQAISITLTRPRLATDTNGDGIPNKDNGSNISSCSSP